MIHRYFLPAFIALSLATGCGSSDEARKAPREHESGAGESGAAGMGGADGRGADGGEAGAGAEGGTSSGGPAAGAGGDDGAGAEGGEGGAAVTLSELALSPSEPTVVAEMGSASASLVLSVEATWSDGSKGSPDGGVWTSDKPEIATVDQNGGVTPSGQLGGPVTIGYRFGELEATATVQVQLKGTVLGGSVQPQERENIDAGTSVDGNAPAWQYPEDGTVFPARMTPPVFQWAASGNGVFKLELSRGSDVRISVYTSLASYQPTPEVWQALAGESDRAIALALSGKTDSAAVSPVRHAAPRSITTADADLPGALYFFDVASSKLSRLDLARAKAQPLFAGDQNCRSCHSPSRDGSLLAFQYDGGGGTAAGLIETASDSEAFPKGTAGMVWNYATIRPDSLGLVTTGAGIMKYWSIASPAQALPVLQGAVDVGGVPATQPSWSPDGSTVVFVSRDKASSDWGFESSDLRTATWNRQEQKLGAASVLSTASAAGTATDTLASPSWSPDSRFIAAGVGDKSYAPSSMSLTLVNVGTKTRQALARASAMAVNEAPSFAPRAQGGYFWLAFVSSRSYGSASGQRLLWVTAIDQSVAPQSDPSHPAFLLPGQDVSSSRLLPQWAPNQCLGRDADCEQDAECCEGLTCEGTVAKTCQAVACKVLGGTCSSDADCCAIQDVSCRAGLDGVKVCQR